MSEPDVSQLIGVSEAIRLIDSTEVRPRVVEVPLAEAQGLRLAEDLCADRDYPPFDKSLMDGFAVRCADLSSVPTILKVIGEIPAGQSSSRTLGQGEAIAIMTGAPLSPGADGIVPVEDVEAPAGLRAGMSIRVLKATEPGRYIARAASDVTGGKTVLRAGVKLEAAQLAVAATVGAAMVKVYAAPRAAVLATGDEIVPFGQMPVGSQIRNSNSIMVAALLRRMGCRVTDLGWAPDQEETIRRALIKGMKEDVLVVTGGMSMGQYDLVPKMLRELKVELKITKLRIKPGKPFVFGIVQRDDGKIGYVFGLPGNPVSGFVCLTRLASRLLNRLGGGESGERWISAALATALPANGPREFYQPALLEWGQNGHTGVTPLPWKGSADLFTLAQANALIVRKENDAPMESGSRIVVLEI